MKLDFRQRLLTSTLLVGVSMVASPAFANGFLWNLVNVAIVLFLLARRRRSLAFA